MCQQKSEASERAWNEFKEAVNRSVMKPAQYSGDIKLEWFDSWIENPNWNIETDKWFYTGGRRDINFVIRDTMAFVKSHGGWALEENEVFNIRMDGNTMHVDTVVAKKEAYDDEEAELRKELLRAQIAALKDQNK